ncbi:MAG: FemAB family PEP-CTERM system-associated protein [bacterium]|nr:FemAB family PEP-CTERM system-associated protein [bacterium]
MKIRQVESSDRDAWNDFVSETHHALRYEWSEIIEKTFSHKPLYLIAENEKGIAGILPLFLFKSSLFGKSMISVPYLNAGGAFGSPEACIELLTRSIAIASNHKVKYLEFRHQANFAECFSKKTVRQHKVSMELRLTEDEQTMFSSFPAKLRSQIRRPLKEGAELQTWQGHNSCSQAIDDFYTVFSENMRDLGTPVYPKKLFSQTMKQFGKNAAITVCYLDKQPAAAGLTVTNGHSREIVWASSLKKFNRQSPNMALYWEIIRQAILSKDKIFDFGRSSPDGGTYKFKQQWGAFPVQLNWHYHSFSGDIPDVNPKNSKYEYIVRMWQRLPLPLANIVGPLLSQHLP